MVMKSLMAVASPDRAFPETRGRDRSAAPALARSIRRILPCLPVGLRPSDHGGRGRFPRRPCHSHGHLIVMAIGGPDFPRQALPVTMPTLSATASGAARKAT